MANRLVAGIVSGGQSGVDRAALAVGRELGIPLYGWCPAGRVAEDGPIDPAWPLRETPASDPTQRTTWNAFDADALLVVSAGPPTGGTALAVRTAQRFGRPIHQADPDHGSAAGVRAWLAAFGSPPLLNVVGPRESENSGIEARCADLFRNVFSVGDDSSPTDASPRGLALVTGGAGYLGRHLLDLCPPGWTVRGTIRPAPAGTPPALEGVDLGERDQVMRAFERLRPTLVIHTAYSLRDPQRDILDATRNTTDAAAAVGAALVHLSSDMVFDGELAPFAESAEPAPVHDYGRWKAAAEDHVRTSYPAAAVVRASLITSFEPPDPRTEWVLGGLRGAAPVALFVDELRTPILAKDLARQIWEIARLEPSRRSGVWHLAGPESLSRYALGTLIAAAHGFDPAPLEPALSSKAPGPRPRDLRLLTGRADRELLTRARPLSVAAGEAAVRRARNHHMQSRITDS